MAFASFSGQRGSPPMADINMVPLIDVMLVLLVIFIVTAPLLTHAVKLELPQASAAVNQRKPDTIEFAIDAAGQRHYNGAPVTRAEAAQQFADAALRVKASGLPLPELHLHADQTVAYQLVAETLADASRAGLAKIGFVSQPDAP